MTATWVDDMPGVDVDQPIAWALTGPGWLGTSSTSTTKEAAALLGVHQGSVHRMARAGRIRGVLVGRGWVLDRASVDALRDELEAEREARTAEVPRNVRLPAAPLLELVDQRGGPRALGLRRGSADDMAIYRARRSGVVTERAADRLAARVLGLTMREVWPDLS